MNNAGTKFLNDSKYQNMSKPDQSEGKPAPPVEMPYEGELIKLPPLNELKMKNISLEEAIKSRKSIRQYTQASVSLDELSYALWGTQGIRTRVRGITLRTVPSAGARHAFESFLLINRVDTLKRGLYRYVASEHALILLDQSKDLVEKITEGCLSQKMIQSSAVTFMWIADIERMTYRYGERGYRYIFLDAGHVSQNLYLIAEQIECGTCAVAAFDDDRLNQALGLDGKKRFVVYLNPLGKR